MLETIRLAFARSASAGQDQRDSGLPHALGNVQANAVIWARTAEGKKARGSRALSVFDRPGRAPAPAPSTHSPVMTPDASGNSMVRPIGMFISRYQNFGSHHFLMRSFEAACHLLKFFIASGCQRNTGLWLWTTRHKVPSSWSDYKTFAFQKLGQNL